ncbi:hypothetical protein C7212DRAFT_219769, partial [Tuber magnatum]
WFHKLQPLSCIICSHAQKYYLFASNMTVNKMMIFFGGKSYHTYGMPSKVIAECYKVFALYDAMYTYN